MRKIYLLVGFFILLIACEKNPDNLTVLINESGTVSIKVLDNNKNIVEGAKVTIYSSNPKDEKIFDDSTSASGICNLGKVLQGQYSYDVQTKKGNITYSYSEYFQVIAGENKEIEVNPFLNVAKAVVKIVNAQSNPIGNVNVALIPHPRYSDIDYSFNDLINEAYFIGKTNSDGLVTFINVPVGSKYFMEYSVLTYYDSDNYDYSFYNNIVYIYRDIKRIFTITANL